MTTFFLLTLELNLCPQNEILVTPLERTDWRMDGQTNGVQRGLLRVEAT